MTEPRDDRFEARREAAVLLGVDINNLSAADSLRIDMVSALRLVIDHEQASVLSGGRADLGKLNVAVQSLIALLPGRELAAPEANRPDPRQEMFRIYMEMRTRGEIDLKPLSADEEKINRLESENAQLRAALGGSSAITPREADITPPGELGQCHVGVVRGPDDPPPRSTRIIDGKAASAAPPSRPQIWDDTDSGKAWNAWRDAGGLVGGDPWANNNR
jgi:hypothetical protein